MLQKQIKAKIFISCGQNKETDEVPIAKNIARELEELGFECYIAVEEQTLKGVKENIFRQLSSSEYFIFIDFKREKIRDKNGEIHRGSLFSHQELSIASYLDLPLLGFQEKGVNKYDGLIGYLQGNCIEFDNRKSLVNLVIEKVKEKKWKPNWKNQLVFEREKGQSTDARRYPENINARFFHIKVKNLHPYKSAKNCYVYLSRITDLENGGAFELKTIEFKWAGFTLPNALIAPSSERVFDAFWINHNNPSQLEFNLFTDSTEFIPNVVGPGKYKFEYLVNSDNFPPVSEEFLVKIGQSLNETKLEVCR